MNVYYDVEDNQYRTYPDGDIATIDQMRELVENKNVSIVKLQQENKQLKGKWNKLKEIAKSQSGFKKRAGLKGGVWFEIDELLDKMQELEKGSDSNE